MYPIGQYFAHQFCHLPEEWLTWLVTGDRGARAIIPRLFPGIEQLQVLLVEVAGVTLVGYNPLGVASLEDALGYARPAGRPDIAWERVLWAQVGVVRVVAVAGGVVGFGDGDRGARGRTRQAICIQTHTHTHTYTHIQLLYTVAR